MRFRDQRQQFPKARETWERQRLADYLVGTAMCPENADPKFNGLKQAFVTEVDDDIARYQVLLLDPSARVETMTREDVNAFLRKQYRLPEPS